MTNLLPIYILIPTHNRLESLKRTLSSVTKLNFPDTFRYVYVLENGKPMTADAYISNMSEKSVIRYQYLKNGNKSAALNYAINNLIPEENAILIFLDDDVRVNNNLIEVYLKAIGHTTSGKYYGGPTDIDFEGMPPAEEWFRHFPNSHTGWTPDLKKGTPKYFLGFNWAAFKTDIVKAGGFEESIGPGTKYALGDESRTQSWLLKIGTEPVFVEDAIVWHFVPEEQATPEWLLDKCIKQGKITAFNKDLGKSAMKRFFIIIIVILKTIVFSLIRYIYIFNKKRYAKYKVKYYRWYGRLIGNMG